MKTCNNCMYQFGTDCSNDNCSLHQGFDVLEPTGWRQAASMKLTCITNNTIADELTIGTEYDGHVNANMLVEVVNDEGTVSEYSLDRFKETACMYDEFEQFADRVQSLIVRWRKFKNDKPDKVDKAIKCCISEISDDYSYMFSRAAERRLDNDK